MGSRPNALYCVDENWRNHVLGSADVITHHLTASRMQCQCIRSTLVNHYQNDESLTFWVMDFVTAQDFSSPPVAHPSFWTSLLPASAISPLTPTNPCELPHAARDQEEKRPEALLKKKEKAKHGKHEKSKHYASADELQPHK